MQDREVMLFLGLFTFAVSIGSIIDVSYLFRIFIDSEKVTAKNIITSKKEFFYYKDFTSVKALKNRTYLMKGVPMTDGYFSRQYTTNDGRILDLSPEIFENYDTLITTIHTHTSHLN